MIMAPYLLNRLTVLLVSLYCTLSVSVAQESYLQWHEVANETALCNDFTKAGFFLSRNLNFSDPNSAKWVIFLESGSLCFSNDTCNRRFFADSVSEVYMIVCTTVIALLAVFYVMYFHVQYGR